MKKILFALLAALMLLALFAVTTATAEAMEVAAEVAQGAEAVEQIAEGGLPAEPFTWTALGTIAGCTAFALLLVQLIKAPIDRVWKIPTRLLVYIVCLIVMILSVVFSGDGLTWASALLAAVNAVIPTLAAMGAYEVTFGRNSQH